jgi:hypothetical protein
MVRNRCLLVCRNLEMLKLLRYYERKEEEIFILEDLLGVGLVEAKGGWEI